MNLYKVILESYDKEAGHYTTQERLVTGDDFQTVAEAEIAHLAGYEHCIELKGIVQVGTVCGHYGKPTDPKVECS